MPASTPNRLYRYPLGADPIDTAGDIERLARDVDTDVEGLPEGVLIRKLKPSTEGGFNVTEFAISGLGFTIPARPLRGTHLISYGIRVVQTGSPAPRIDTVIALSIRANSVTGTLWDSHIYPWPLSTAYGTTLVGTFTPSGLTAGGNYVITTNTDGLGTYQVTNASWVAVTEVGWVVP